ncbi:MAG: hypothetical protein DMG81_04160, partial [Acidobacteria bacterium]
MVGRAGELTSGFAVRSICGGRGTGRVAGAAIGSCGRATFAGESVIPEERFIPGCGGRGMTRAGDTGCEAPTSGCIPGFATGAFPTVAGVDAAGIPGFAAFAAGTPGRAGM